MLRCNTLQSVPRTIFCSMQSTDIFTSETWTFHYNISNFVSLLESVLDDPNLTLHEVNIVSIVSYLCALCASVVVVCNKTFPAVIFLLFLNYIFCCYIFLGLLDCYFCMSLKSIGLNTFSVNVVISKVVVLTL